MDFLIGKAAIYTFFLDSSAKHSALRISTCTQSLSRPSVMFASLMASAKSPRSISWCTIAQRPLMTRSLGLSRSSSLLGAPILGSLKGSTTSSSFVSIFAGYTESGYRGGISAISACLRSLGLTSGFSSLSG